MGTQHQQTRLCELVVKWYIFHKIREVCCRSLHIQPYAHVSNKYSTCTAYSAVLNVPRFSFTVKHTFLPLFLHEIPLRHHCVPASWWHSIRHCINSLSTIQSNCYLVVSLSTLSNITGVLNSAGLLGWLIPALFGAPLCFWPSQ